MKTVKYTIISGLVLGSMALGGNVFAAEVATRNTDAQITFGENDENVEVVDPIDPAIPVVPVDPVNPGTPVEPGSPGPLSLDYASSLNFGKQKIKSSDEVYFAKAQVVSDKDGVDPTPREVPLYAQVTDNRGTQAGWSLSVKQNGQFKAGDKTLTGAKIEFINAEIATISESLVPSVLKTSFDLTADGTGAAQNIMAAKANQGAGTFIYRFGNKDTKASSVKLSVPGKTLKMKDVNYNTTLTWSLNDVPGVDA